MERETECDSTEEIVITEKMISAGAAVLEAYRDFRVDEAIAKAVYSAMRVARDKEFPLAH